MRKFIKVNIIIIVIIISVFLIAWFVPFFQLKYVKRYETEFENIFWEREDTLDSQGRIQIKWNFTEEEITMMVIGATTGYIALGFSWNPTMEGADVVIGWVRNNKVHLQDFHTIGNSQPILDSQQDVALLFGEENGTHTILCFKRKLNTCDKQDIAITGSTIYIFYTFHYEDPSDISNLHLHHHGRKEMFVPLHLLDVKHPIPPLENVDYIDVGANKTRIHIKFKESYYWCKFIKIPNFGEKRHMIGYIPMIQPDHLDSVHHILLYECAGYDLDKRYGINDTDGHKCFILWNMYKETACRKEIVSWGVGSKGEFFPSHIGYPFGSSDDKPHYILIQVHYNYKKYKKGFEDSSKLRLYHTNQLRPNEASAFNVLAKHFEIIPKEQQDFPTIAICSADCTMNFPSDGIHAFRYLLHGHSSVRKIRLHHFRNGIEINTIVDENFRFNYQQARFLKNELVILPNDSLAVECLHDTRNRSITTVSGFASEDEMCLAIIQYYPPMELAFCSSVLDPVAVHEVTGFYYFSQKDVADFFLNSILYGIYYQLTIFYIQYKSLTNTQIDAVKNLYLTGDQISFCLNDTTMFEYNAKKIVSFSNFKKLVKTDECRIDGLQ